MGRNINAVLHACRKQIPDDFESEHLASFDKLIEDVAFKAPEQWHPYWHMTANILTKMIGKPENEWQERIDDIFSDRASVAEG